MRYVNSYQNPNDNWRPGYLRWRRQNVTYRGIRDSEKSLSDDRGNGNLAMLGLGLYTVPASNKSMARGYGDLYFVYGAIPKKPLIVGTLNAWELWSQKHIYNFDTRAFYAAGGQIREKMLELGYDGVIIKGREMVNYTPDPNEVKFFRYEDDLEEFYFRIINQK
jgi:hypothetical protein